MNNSLARKFTFSSLLFFALPNIIMMIFLSLYTIVDGIFVSVYAGTTALSAVNMIYPTICIQMALGIMLATGGSAIIARKLGEKKEKEARGNFSFIILISLLLGIIIALLGNLFIDEIVIALGSSKAQYDMCKTYGAILFLFAPAFFLQTAFQIFFVVAGKPGLGLFATIGAGIANMLMDYYFIGVLHMGIGGAAIATGIGYCIPAFVGLYFFGILKKSNLYFCKPIWDIKMLLQTCTNGSSEMVTNLATAITTFLFNYSFMKFYGEDGVASITIVLYFQFVFSAIYLGYSLGVAPVISYKYGAGDRPQLKSIYKNSLIFLTVSSIFSYIISLIVLEPALGVFTDKSTKLFQITKDGFPIFATSFLFMGFSIFASAMFTAFSDGKVSAIISMARTFLFLAGSILLLPLLIGQLGLWIAVPLAEIAGVIFSVIFLSTKKKKYHY